MYLLINHSYNQSMTPWSLARRGNSLGITGNPIYYSSNLDSGCSKCPKTSPEVYSSDIDVIRLYKEFIAQCYKCEHYHIDPFCKCGLVRTNSSTCKCGRMALWDCFQGKCHQCSEIHHYPVAVNSESFQDLASTVDIKMMKINEMKQETRTTKLVVYINYIADSVKDTFVTVTTIN